MSDVVAIIVATDGARALESLVARMPVWIVDSPANRPHVERLWQDLRAGAPAGQRDRLTIFTPPAEHSEADEIAAFVLEDVMLHHAGALELQIHGTALTPRLAHALAVAGFVVERSDAGALSCRQA